MNLAVGYETSVTEGTDTSSHIFLATIEINDPDFGSSNNTLSIIPSADDQYFEIDDATRTLYLAAGTTFNRDTQQFYNIQIQVDDPGAVGSMPAPIDYQLEVVEELAPSIVLGSTDVETVYASSIYEYDHQSWENVHGSPSVSAANPNDYFLVIDDAAVQLDVPGTYTVFYKLFDTTWAEILEAQKTRQVEVVARDLQPYAGMPFDRDDWSESNRMGISGYICSD